MVREFLWKDIKSHLVHPAHFCAFYAVQNLRKWGNLFTSLETFWVVHCWLIMSPQKLTSGPRNFMKGPQKSLWSYPAHFRQIYVSIHDAISGTIKAITTEPALIMHFIVVKERKYGTPNATIFPLTCLIVSSDFRFPIFDFRLSIFDFLN